jgi:hypothetical protein
MQDMMGVGGNVWGHGQETAALWDFGPSAAGLCSVLDQLGHPGDVRCMTAVPPKADVHPRSCHVANVPGGDILLSSPARIIGMGAMGQESATDLECRLAQSQRELSEAREQQAATAEVLRIISSSPGDLQPVFETILANATRICGAIFGMLNLYDGNRFRTVAFHNAPPRYVEAEVPAIPPPP